MVIDDQQNWPLAYDAVEAGSSTLEDYIYQVTPASPTPEMSTTAKPFHQTSTGAWLGFFHVPKSYLFKTYSLCDNLMNSSIPPAEINALPSQPK